MITPHELTQAEFDAYVRKIESYAASSRKVMEVALCAHALALQAKFVANPYLALVADVEALLGAAQSIRDRVLALPAPPVAEDPPVVEDPPPPPPPVVVAPPPSTDFPNRPQGLGTFLDWDCGALVPPEVEIGYSDQYGTNPDTYVVGGRVLRRHRIPAIFTIVDGQRALVPGAQVGGGFMAMGVYFDEVFVARWLTPSPNLIGDGAGSKGLMIDFHGGGSVYFNYETTPDPLIKPIFLAVPDIRYDDKWLPRNVASTPIVRGTRGLWEAYVKLNTPGQKNGIIRAWSQGVLQVEITDVIFRLDDRLIGGVRSNFYQNQAQPFEMWWDVDRILVAGR